jgi:hypothetical protein
LSPQQVLLPATEVPDKRCRSNRTQSVALVCFLVVDDSSRYWNRSRTWLRGDLLLVGRSCLAPFSLKVTFMLPYPEYASLC